MNKKLNNKLKACPAVAAALILCVMTGLQPVSGKNALYFNDVGQQLLKKSEYYKASLQFRSALNANPGYLDAMLGLAEAYYRLQLNDRSLEIYRSALLIDRKSWKARLGIGLNLTVMGRFDPALKEFEDAEKISGGNVDVHYAIAALYYTMGRQPWAKRKLETVFRVNRFHYEGLLLSARLSSDEKRYKNAENYIDRAISVNTESPEAYTLKGEIRLKRSLEEGEPDYAGVLEACRQALSISPGHPGANRIAGSMHYLKGEFADAYKSFSTAYESSKNSDILYNMAVTADSINKKDEALRYLLLALKERPLDSILSARLEFHLVMNNYKIGHPARIMMSADSLDLARKRIKQHLPDQGILYLRKAILMNPEDLAAREELMSYYEVKSLNRMYIDELKELARISGMQKYHDLLAAAVIKRRNLMYHSEGFSQEVPERDVPSVLVLDFSNTRTLPLHADGGSVAAGAFSFSLQQFGRMKTVGLKNQADYSKHLKPASGSIHRTIELLAEGIKSGLLEPVDFIITGELTEDADMISVDFSLMDFHRGVILSNFSLRDSGRQALSSISLRGARRVFDIIPYRGRVLKVKEHDIIVNMGLHDGLQKGQKFVIYKEGISSRKARRYAIMLEVVEADTIVSRMKPGNVKDLDIIDPRDRVFPLTQRRATRIE